MEVSVDKMIQYIHRLLPYITVRTFLCLLTLPAYVYYFSEARVLHKSSLTDYFDPPVLAGKPVIRGTRISVDPVPELPASGWRESTIL